MRRRSPGTCSRPQFDVARQLATYHDKFPFGFVIMLGDNIYGSQDLSRKFEQPYQSFMLVEIDGKQLFFQAISRGGKTVDRGTITQLEHKVVASPPGTATQPAPTARPAAGP